ncbi:hypothetical protein CIHG_08190 [Coccidioides immitis H538.4]|uniref:Uncharacterized protein n=1 Tax=Coccidioides immitis H538.4 TaxID=396776 RepID=A0A0J8RYX8_COCIT|nr:hypothetical protein CIHG_08190 [Coccidioides immitis H538.4]
MAGCSCVRSFLPASTMLVVTGRDLTHDKARSYRPPCPENTDRDATVEVDDFNAKSFKPRSFDESDLDRLNIRLLPLDVAQADQLQPCFYAPVPESELPQAPWTDMGLVTVDKLQEAHQRRARAVGYNLRNASLWLKSKFWDCEQLHTD